jgi:hypothetical protein
MNSELRDNIEAGSMSRSLYRDNKDPLCCTVLSYSSQQVCIRVKVCHSFLGLSEGHPQQTIIYTY